MRMNKKDLGHKQLKSICHLSDQMLTYTLYIKDLDLDLGLRTSLLQSLPCLRRLYATDLASSLFRGSPPIPKGWLQKFDRKIKKSNFSNKWQDPDSRFSLRDSK